MPRPRNRKTGFWVAGTLVVALLAAACAASTGVRDTENERAAPTTAPTSLATSLASTTTATATTATSSTAATTTTGLVTTTSIPSAPSTTTGSATTTTRAIGAPYDGPGPRVGDRVAVVGVAFDDFLNVRAGPGVGYRVVATLPPTAIDIGVTGRARLFPSSLWYEINTGGEDGWVNASYIALIGATDDATSDVVAAHGSIPSANTMVALGIIVASHFAGDESGTRVVVTEAPSVGDVGEITYDVVGLADDSITGYRLRIFGQQNGGVGPFSLYGVERTSLCWRGVADDGMCV